MKNFYKKLFPSLLCLILLIGNVFSVFGSGGNINYSKLYIKNGSGVYKNATSNVITLKNYPTNVTIKRTDAENKVNIVGAVITIYDSNDNEVVTFTTGSEPKSLKGVLTGGESYTIKEITSAYGHIPEVIEKIIVIEDTPDEQIFIIKDKIDDENGYWQLFNNDYRLKSAVTKSTESSIVSSGEQTIDVQLKRTTIGYQRYSYSSPGSSDFIYNTDGYDYLKITSIVCDKSFSPNLASEYFDIYQNTPFANGNTVGSLSDLGLPVFRADIRDATPGDNQLSSPKIFNISGIDSFRIGYYCRNATTSNHPEYVFTYELIKEEEVSSFPKGFTKSDFYFYNDLERSVSGSGQCSLTSDDKVSFTPVNFNDSVSSISISNGYSKESDLDDLDYDDFTNISCSKSSDSYLIKSAEFVPKYENTYYKVIANGEEFKIRLETISTGIEVYGFQINASNSEGSASEYCPSFRTMSRSDKLQVKSTDNSNNKRLYPVENYGTVYAPSSVENSDMTVLSDNAMHYQAHDEGFFENYLNDFPSKYYALTLKNLFYRYHNLTDEFKFRAYCELEDGTIIYSDNIVPASVKSVGEAVYNKKISYSSITHQWIYDYVIYPTSLKSNIVNITYFLLEMTDAQSKDDLEYALCNQWYKDANYWCNNSFDYEKESYYDRGTKFVCTSEITHNGKTYNVESALLEILNDISVTKYDTVSDWIYHNQKDYQFEGISYQCEFTNNQMIVFD